MVIPFANSFGYSVGEQVVLSGIGSITRNGITTVAGTYTVQEVKVRQGITMVKINNVYVSSGNMKYISSVTGYTLNQQFIECIAFASGVSVFYAFAKGFSYSFGS